MSQSTLLGCFRVQVTECSVVTNANLILGKNAVALTEAVNTKNQHSIKLRSLH